MKDMNKQIEEIVQGIYSTYGTGALYKRNRDRTYKDYDGELEKDDADKLYNDIYALIQKEREDAIKDIVKDIGNLKLKERKIDYSYVNIPEEWEAEPENIEKRGYNQAVREINNKIYLFITNNLSQTKGGKQ